MLEKNGVVNDTSPSSSKRDDSREEISCKRNNFFLGKMFLSVMLSHLEKVLLINVTLGRRKRGRDRKENK